MNAGNAKAQAEALAARRAAARAQRDFAAADALRQQISELGFVVVDSADGWSLQPLEDGPSSTIAAQTQAADAADDGSPIGAEARVLAVVMVNGWPQDANRCVEALLAHEHDVHVLVVAVGDRDGIHAWARSVADSDPQRCSAICLSETGDHWGAVHRAVIQRCAATYVAVLDSSTVVTGPALTQCCDAIERDHAAAVGWRGADVDRADNWRSVVAVEGQADVLLSYLLVVPADIAKAVPPSAKARFYRNADLEWSLMIRRWWHDQHGEPARLLALGASLPASQGRHHGYHDTDPEYRDRESRATYNRILSAFRGRDEILRPQ